MKIEVLFPEICNLYGELWNVRFLERSYPDAEIIETSLTDEPLFATETPDLIYMGTMSENSQLLVIEKLMPYKKRLMELIGSGAFFLITGNALEVFGKRIEDKDGTVVECLGIFRTYAVRDMRNRFNSLYIGDFADGEDSMKIVGFKSQFTQSYLEPDETPAPLFMTQRGPGLDPDMKEEGIRVNNFMATYVIGPLLVLNPPFAKYLLEKCGADRGELVFEDAAMEAYDARVREYSDPSTGFYY